MAYDEQLAERVHQVLVAQSGVVQKRMFGGLAFMVNGNMSVGIYRDRLMVWVGPEGYEEALARTHCQPMDITGRPMRGVRHGRGGGCLYRRGVGGVGPHGGPICHEPPEEIARFFVHKARRQNSTYLTA